MGELEGKVAIVTGAASGIGQATAAMLRGHGAVVVGVDVTEAEGTGIVADLASVDACGEVVERVVAAHGRVDILVNAAGISSGAGLLDTTVDIWEHVLAVNLRAPMLLMQHAARHMVSQGDGGRIVNVSSGSAFRALPSTPAYGASKAGLLSLTRMAAGELGPHGINVNAVAPGITATPMALRTIGARAAGGLDELVSEGPMANLLHRVSTAEDVAGVIVFLCLPESRQVTGQTIHTSAGSIV
ncbi:MAG TPA: SDR family oxidoreductase [Acidimicrobiales bacterium]|nr:SDR family oxidoreductase [Acidimicrobiales bacterium]